MNNKKANTNNKKKIIKEKKPKIKSEKKNPSKPQKIIKKTFPMPPQPENYKQINEVYDKGILELVDYKGNITECDIYGSPKKKFFNDITGITSFQERFNKGLINECKLNNKSLYIPKTINFEGSSMFPRPLSLPFVSQAENPQKLVNEVKKEGRVMVKKNRNTFSLKKPLKDKNTIPSFICHKIGKNYPNERNYLIKLIDNFISEKKKEHKFESDYVEKNSNIKALNNYKKKLNENMTNELYNGKIISSSKQKDLILKYDSIRKAIYHKGIKYSSGKNIDGNKIINFEAYKKLYKINGVGNENNMFKHPDMINTFISLNKNKSISNIEDKNLSYSSENNKYKTLFPKNNNTNKMMMKTFSLLNRENKIKLLKENIKEKDKIFNNNEYIFNNDEKFKKTITTEFDKNNDESLTNTFYNDKITNFKNKNLYTPKVFLINNNDLNISNNYKTANTFYKNRKQNLSKFKENNILKNNEKDNYSYISEEKKNENSFINKFKTGYNFRSIKDINNKTAKENDLLKGFISPEIKNDFKLRIYKNKKKDSTLKNYINELELIKKVNKIAVEKEKRMNLFRDNLLRKKLEGKKIFEHNYKK